MITAAYVALAGVVTISFGVAYLVWSHRMARLVGIVLRSAPARADYRSIYGGAQIAVGIFFLIAAWHRPWRTAGLVAVSLFALGFGVTRLTSLAIERVGRRDVQWIVGALETIAGVVGILLMLVSTRGV